MAHQSEFTAHRGESIAHLDGFTAHRGEFTAHRGISMAHRGELTAHRDSLVKRRRPKASAPTRDCKSRCTVRKGGTGFASLHRLPTTAHRGESMAHRGEFTAQWGESTARRLSAWPYGLEPLLERVTSRSIVARAPGGVVGLCIRLAVRSDL
eukprot:340496-Prorocentrum_minimum.AAC.1